MSSRLNTVTQTPRWLAAWLTHRVRSRKRRSTSSSRDAHAPGGKAKRSFDVRVRVSEVLDHTLRVFGPRVAKWVAPEEAAKKQREQGSSALSSANLWSSEDDHILPLTYEYAYGGSEAL